MADMPAPKRVLKVAAGWSLLALGLCMLALAGVGIAHQFRQEEYPPGLRFFAIVGLLVILGVSAVVGGIRLRNVPPSAAPQLVTPRRLIGHGVRLIAIGTLCFVYGLTLRGWMSWALAGSGILSILYSAALFYQARRPGAPPPSGTA